MKAEGDSDFSLSLLEAAEEGSIAVTDDCVMKIRVKDTGSEYPVNDFDTTLFASKAVGLSQVRGNR
jgi:hypothetical protein